MFNPLSDVTNYLGEAKAPWDATQTYWHFIHKDQFFNNNDFIDTYWDMQSGELRWVRMNDTDFVAQIKSGLEAASFTNEDFILTGCNPNLVSGAEKKLPDNNRRSK